jgi:hypothetical protein
VVVVAEEEAAAAEEVVGRRRRRRSGDGTCLTMRTPFSLSQKKPLRA